VGRTLAALTEGLGPRQAAVCRELTKLHEEVRRGALTELAEHYAKDAETRGEFTIVIEPPAEATAPDAEEVDALLRRALQNASVKDAVSDVAAATGLPRREIYQRALALGEGGDGAPK
jgi:16S rRNA (cytidine1402-2'-O)-methyltransferase